MQQRRYRRHPRSVAVHPRALVAVLTFLTLVLSLLAVPSGARAWTEPSVTLPPANETFPAFPDVVVDEAGFVHVTWIRLISEFRVGPIYYTRGQLSVDTTGQAVVTWEGVQDIGLGVNGRSVNNPRIAVTDTGTVYVVYGGDNDLYIVLRNDQRGAANNWVEDTTFTMVGDGNAANFDVALAVDDDGRPHVAWGGGFGDGPGSRLFYLYRRSDGNWSGRRQISTGAFLIRNVNMAANGNGDSASVQVVAQVQQDEKNNVQTVFHLNGTPEGGFNQKRLPDVLGVPLNRSPGAIFPDVAFDQTDGTVYASFTSVAANNSFALNVARSTDGGTSWDTNSKVAVQINTTLWPQQQALQVRGGVASTVSQHIQADKPSAAQIYYQESNLNTGDRSPFLTISDPANENHSSPTFSLKGDFRAAVFNQQGFDRIHYNIDTSALPDPPAGTIAVNSNADFTGTTTATVNFLNLSQPTDQLSYRLSNTADGIGAAPYTPLPANATVDFALEPAPADSPDCIERTVYAQLRNNASQLESTVVSDAIVLDPGVDTAVVVENPFLPGNSVPATGGTDGDPTYTRVTSFFAAVAPNSGECGTITSARYRSAQPDSSPFADIVPTTGALVSLLSDSEGRNDLVIEVGDSNGNTTQVSRSIIYDNTPPVISNSASGSLTPLDSAGNPVTGISVDPSDPDLPDEDLLVQLRAADLLISDNLYGTAADEPFPFWGLWLANSTTAVDPTDQDALNALNWSTAAVLPDNVTTGQGGSVTVDVFDWSLAAGLDPEVITDDQPTPVYVCAKALDGAGNPSVQAVCTDTPVVIDPSVGLLRVVLPFTTSN